MRKKNNFNIVIAGLGLVSLVVEIIQDEIRAREEEKYIDEKVEKEVARRLKESEEE